MNDLALQSTVCITLIKMTYLKRDTIKNILNTTRKRMDSIYIIQYSNALWSKYSNEDGLQKHFEWTMKTEDPSVCPHTIYMNLLKLEYNTVYIYVYT